MKLVIFEGMDGTGKTTLRKKFEHKSKYKHTVIDRFTGSAIVYDEIYGRKSNKNSHLIFETKLKEIIDVYLVYLFCDRDILRKRLKKKKDIISKEDLDKADTLYDEYLDDTSFKLIGIDTGRDTISKSVDKIVKFVENGKWSLLIDLDIY